MTRNMRRILLGSAMIVGLSACGGDDNTSSPPATPPPTGTTPPPASPTPTPPTSVAGQISAAFGTIFAANRNSEPTDPAPGALGPVNKTAEPINF